MKIVWDTLKTLMYYDGPVIFHAKTDTGRHVFGVYVADSDDSARTFLLMGVSERQLAAVLSSAATPYQIQVSKKGWGRFLFNLDESNTLFPISLEECRLNGYLSTPGQRLDGLDNPNEIVRKKAKGGYQWIKGNNRKGRHKSALKRFHWQYKTKFPEQWLKRKFKSIAQQPKD